MAVFVAGTQQSPVIVAVVVDVIAVVIIMGVFPCNSLLSSCVFRHPFEMPVVFVYSFSGGNSEVAG